MGVPVQSEALRLVTHQLNLRIDLTKGCRLEGVLCPVKYQDFPVDAERSDNIGVLRLVSSLVHLSRVLDLLDNVALYGRNVSLSVATNLSSVIVIVVRVGSDSLGNLNVGDLDKVGAFIGCVSAKEQTVNAIILALRVLDIREPLDGESWPRQRRSALVSWEDREPARQCSYPRIMSYRKGLFFFQVLYSLAVVSRYLNCCNALQLHTFVDKALSLVIFLFLDHVDCDVHEQRPLAWHWI